MSEPYRVQSIVQTPLLRLTTDEILYNLKFFLISRLKSAGVVENITAMFGEGIFVLYVMLATLH
jgi:hypothetical protein